MDGAGSRTRALVVAGGDAPPAELVPLPESETLIVAADSGLHTIHALGLIADVVIGDFDSVSSNEVRRAESNGARLIRHSRDKNATDLELALDHCETAGVAVVDVIGATGSRIDHELANISLMASPRWKAMDVTSIDARGRLIVVHSRRVLPAKRGAIVSLIAVGGIAEGVTTEGLAWPLDDEDLATGTTRGVSNVATDVSPTVTIGGGTLIAVLPWNTADEAWTPPADQ